MACAPLHADVRFWRDAALPGVEARFSAYRAKAFRTHTHQVWTIALLTHGSTRFHLHGQTHAASAGQMVVIEPEAPHACNPEPGGLSYRLLSLAPAWLNAANNGAPPAFPRPVLDDPELIRAWTALHEAFATAAADKAPLLLACLSGLIARHAAPAPGGPVDPAATPNPHPAIDNARRRIQNHPGEFVPLADLAREAGLSPHHFLRVFKAATGLPPHAYQLQQAIEHAKGLLAAGTPITQAALDAGFADQSHFSRLFRQFTGATPGQYAAS